VTEPGLFRFVDMNARNRPAGAQTYYRLVR
jgi:hypothetical protein